MRRSKERLTPIPLSVRAVAYVFLGALMCARAWGADTVTVVSPDEAAVFDVTFH